ncbi:MAG: DUF4998 domain-containing protein [Candidatus Cloacimonetes bacterium]|nr:DUF4998 domain-containing protein [Candidatus Cloacimonadota bacterium]
MHKFVNQTGFILFIFFLFGFISCSDMDETYRHFWEVGEKLYPAPVDSLQAHAGKNRIGLSWIIYGDPNVDKAKIFWENRSDSLEIPIQSNGGKDSMYVIIDNLAEGTYSFDILTYNKKGNISVSRSVIGTVFGDVYENSLLPRFMQSAFYKEDALFITWGNPADTTSIGSEICYRNMAGSYNRVIADNSAEITSIADYDYDSDPTFTYRTIYVPPMAIDTFYSAVQTVKVKGAPHYYPKLNWTATASSFDSRPGGSYRPPQYTIDNNLSTIWVNQISPQTYYPHTLTIDMGAVVSVDGVALRVQKRNETPRLIDVYVSVDGIKWDLMGLFTVENTANVVQNFDFYETQQIRYFRIVGKEPSGNTNNIVIAEVDAYTYNDDNYTSERYTSTDYSYDGTIKKLQSHIIGKGIAMVLTGDGFVDKDFKGVSSTFDQLMHSVMEGYFSEEPYKSLRDRFDVYSVAAVSPNWGFSGETKTAFGCAYGDGTHITGDNGKVFQYANRISGIELSETVVVVVLNSIRYGGTCFYYSDGASIAYCPIAKGDEGLFHRLVLHESGGHGFSKLKDEYGNSGAISEAAAAKYVEQYNKFGWGKNVDVTNDPEKVHWSYFLKDIRYKSQVGIYEGALTYSTGAYRPTENSIMRYNTGGFNAPSREAIYKRAMQLSEGGDWIYDYETFVEFDGPSRTRIATRSIMVPSDFEPTAPPVFIKGSWRDAQKNTIGN